MTYVTAVSANVMDDPGFLQSVREAPPSVLHLGHVLPLNSVFGPTADYSGFKPELVPVETIRQRRNRIRTFIHELHAAGVQRVVCYINPAIIGGDHTSRQGFWSFYDHWDDYASLGIGGKPSRDPIRWMQRERQSFGAWAPEPNYPLWLYRPCVNEPAWSRYHEAVVRLVAECGYDGVFVDDCIVECHHDECARRFAEFLKRRYRGKHAEALLGDDHSMGAIQPLWQGDAQGTFRDAATHLFWQESMRNYLDRIQAAAHAHNLEFIAVANWGAISRVRGAAGRAQSGKDIEVWKPATQWVMFEEAHPSGLFGADVPFGYSLQYNQSLMLGIRPVVHGYAATPQQIDLGFAECAAGGGGAFVQPDMQHPEIRRKWRNFFEANGDVLERFSLVAPVGLVLAYDELRYNNKEHLRQALATAQELYSAHIPFAALSKSHLVASALRAYRVLIVPNVKYMEEHHIGAITEFVKNGGKLLTAGDCAMFDYSVNERDAKHRRILHDAAAQNASGTLHVSSLEELVSRQALDSIAALDILDPGEFAKRAGEIVAETKNAREPAPLQTALTKLAGEDLSVTASAPGIRTVVYERLGRKQGALTVHAVRYAVSVTGESVSAHSPAPLRVAVPVPPGWKPQSASVRSPDNPEIAIAIAFKGKAAHCTIPPFDVYSLLVVRLSRRESSPQ
ncbi:MAG: hypothetical protein HUU46_21735 [Candidatus Hydrogenedentes bacterium]|nr:hypothetical protein [Candidatus Hydrogenedentota bacterium]